MNKKSVLRVEKHASISIGCCSTEESIRGREFILFITAIILSYLRKLWREKIKTDKILLRKHPTEIDILDEMRSFRYIEYEGQDGYILHL